MKKSYIIKYLNLFYIISTILFLFMSFNADTYKNSYIVTILINFFAVINLLIIGKFPKLLSNRDLFLNKSSSAFGGVFIMFILLYFLT